MTILHTNTRDCAYHPHLHVLMPGGKYSAKIRLMEKKGLQVSLLSKSTGKDFFAKLLESIAELGLQVPGN